VKAIKMWWEYIVAAVVLILAGYGFLSLTGLETRNLSRKTSRTAESMYDNYADSGRRQRRHARNPGGGRHEDEDGETS
jgi:hypothetical protein